MAYLTPEEFAGTVSASDGLRDVPQSQLGAALRSGGYGWLAGMGHLGSALGAPTDDFARRMGEEQAFFQRNAPGATSFETAVAPGGSLADYLLWLAGSSAPYMAEFAAGAGAGSLAAKGARAALTREVAEQAAARLPMGGVSGAEVAAGLEAAQRAAAMERAGLIGGVAASYPSSIGDVLANQQEEAQTYDLPAALALAVPYAGLNAIGGEAAVLKALTNRVTRGEGAKELARHVAGTAALTGLKEGASETGQEVLNQMGRMAVSPEATLTSGDALNRYFESFMGGALLGGTMGGAASAFDKPTSLSHDDLAKRADDLLQYHHNYTTDQAIIKQAAAAEKEFAATQEQARSDLEDIVERLRSQQAGAQEREDSTRQQQAAQAKHDAAWGDYGLQLLEDIQLDRQTTPDPDAAFLDEVTARLQTSGLSGKALAAAQEHALNFATLSPEQQDQFLQLLEDPANAPGRGFARQRSAEINDRAASAIINALPNHPKFSDPLNALYAIQQQQAEARREAEARRQEEAELAAVIRAKDEEVARREAARRAAEVGPPDASPAEPAAPNELDAEALGIKEKQPKAEPPASATPAPVEPEFSLLQGAKTPPVKRQGGYTREEAQQLQRELYDEAVRFATVGDAKNARVAIATAKQRLARVPREWLLDPRTIVPPEQHSLLTKTGAVAKRASAATTNDLLIGSEISTPAPAQRTAQPKEKRNARKTTREKIAEQAADADERQDAAQENADEGLLTQGAAPAPATEPAPVEESPAPAKASALPETVKATDDAIDEAYAALEEAETPTEQAKLGARIKRLERHRVRLLEAVQATREVEEAVAVAEGEAPEETTVDDLLGSRSIETPFGPGYEAPAVAIRPVQYMMTPLTQGLDATMDAIAANGSRLNKALVAALRTTGLDGVTLRYVAEANVGANGNRVGGVYDPETRTVTIYRGGENPQVVLHELVHGATIGRLVRARELLGKVKPTPEEANLIHAYRQLAKLFEDAKRALPAEWYGFKSIEEFVSEGFTNPEFQQAMMATTSRRPSSPLAPSLWQRFVARIKDILGFDKDSPLHNTSLLERFMQVAPMFMGEAQVVANAVPLYSPAQDAVTAALSPAEPAPVGGAIRFMAQKLAGLATPMDQQLYRADTGEIVSAYEPDTAQKRTEWLRKAKVTLRHGLQEITTQRFTASLSKGFSSLLNTVAQANHLKAFFRTFFNARMAAAYRLSEADRAKFNDMMAATTLVKSKALTDRFMMDWINSGRAVVPVHDREDIPRIDPELAAMGMFTVEDFTKGVQPEGYGEVRIEGLTQDSPLWEAYTGAMDALFTAAAARYEAQIKNREAILGLQFQSQIGNALRNKEVLREIEQLVKLLRVPHAKVMLEGRKVDPSARATFTLAGKEPEYDAEGKRTSDGSGALGEAAKFRDYVGRVIRGVASDADLKWLAEKSEVPVETLARYNTAAQAWGVKMPVTHLIENELKIDAFNENKSSEAALYAIQTVAGGYVPLRRYGKYQLSFVYVDPTTGKKLDVLHKYEQALPFLLSNDIESHLAPLQREWNEAHKDTAVNVAVDTDAEGNEVMVKARIVALDPIGTPPKAATLSTNFEAVEAALSSINVKLSYEARKGLIQVMTRSDAALRRQLKREGVPGFDMNFVHVVSEHLNMQAAISAYKTFAPAIESIANSDARVRPELWGSGKPEIEDLKAAYRTAVANFGADSEQAKVAHRALMQTAQAYNGQHKAVEAEMAAEDAPGDAKLAARAKQLRTKVDRFVEQEGPRVKEMVANYAEWWNREGAMEDPTRWREFKSGVTVVQLGASLSTALTNLSSLPLHTFSALASYNPHTGFGGGFGGSRAYSAITKAVKAIAPITGRTASQNTFGSEVFFAEEKLREFRDLAEKNGTHAGYDATTWATMLKLSEQGVLQAQRYNEMMGQANRAQYGDAWGKITSRMMAVFSATEEMNRMSTALASYELFSAEGAKAGLAGDQLQAYVLENVEKIVYSTQGDYGMENRPRLFRGDVTSILFMYKTFAITTVELLARMSPQGRATFLGLLWLMAGTQGIPFWEEVLALLDFTTQKTGVGLGVTKGNAERALKAWLHELGLDEAVMKGVLDPLTGVNVFGRAGIDIGIPGFGLLRPGAEFEKELGKALGPAVGVVKGAYEALGAATSGDFETALRTQPVTGLRHLADAYTYAKYDAVMNKRGQVVVADPSAAQIVARAIGFYPQELQAANEMVRLENYTRAYMKEITSGLYEQFSRAAILRDTSEMQAIRRQVQDHNLTFRGTELEIRGFDKNAERHAKEAKAELVERTAKTLPKAQKAAYEREFGRE